VFSNGYQEEEESVLGNSEGVSHFIDLPKKSYPEDQDAEIASDAEDDGELGAADERGNGRRMLQVEVADFRYAA
jgi:hypothetical protein